VVYRVGLENRRSRKVPVGSNPTPSAYFPITALSSQKAEWIVYGGCFRRLLGSFLAAKTHALMGGGRRSVFC
jgi:hypothetical protein